jgi:predicted ABC-type transport system involved in lysophospholipase L1 biosynthesis ATPase subunit
VIVTHDADIGALCNRIVRMNDGEIVDQGHGQAPEAVT